MKKTQRWMELLNTLVEEQNFQTVAELAEQAAVSSRMIHSNLRDISFLQLLHDAELIKEPSIGIRLRYTQKQREVIYRQFQKNCFEISVLLGKRNDLHTVLHMPLIYRDVIRMEDLVDALYHSKSSLTTVLEKAERLAENYNCGLRKHSSYSLSLEGHREDIRSLFYRFVDTLPTQGYQHNDLDVHLPDTLYEKTKMVSDVQTIRMITPIVKSSKASLNTHCYDCDFGISILKCYILLTRCQIDRSV